MENNQRERQDGGVSAAGIPSSDAQADPALLWLKLIDKSRYTFYKLTEGKPPDEERKEAQRTIYYVGLLTK